MRVELVPMIRAIVLSLLIATGANAQVYSLSPAEKAAAIEAASLRPDADDPALLPGLSIDRKMHGEFGAMIGTGGARGIYGIVGVPLGQQGSATFAFSNTRLPGFNQYRSFDQRQLSIGANFGAGMLDR